MSQKSVEDVAREALNSILATSIRRRVEYGGVIYRERGEFRATPPRTSDLGNKVDVGLRQKTRSYPEGTTPVAFYHTHPNAFVGPIPMQYNEWSDDDRGVADDNSLDGYLGTLDGSFFKYDQKLGKLLRIGGRHTKQLKNEE